MKYFRCSAAFRTLSAALVVVATVASAGCSPVGDVIGEKEEAVAIKQVLEAQPGVSSVETAVEDRGLDAGIRRSTSVEMAASATPAQVRYVVEVWNNRRSRTSNRNNTLDVALGSSSFQIVGGLPASVAGAAASWATEAAADVPISSQVDSTAFGDDLAISTFVNVKHLSPVEQLAIADRLRDLGTIRFAPGNLFDSTKIAGRPDALPTIAAAYEDVFADIASQDSADERQFGIRSDSESVRWVWFVLPTSMVSSGDFLGGDSAAWRMIRRVFQDTPANASNLKIGLSTSDLQIGVVSTSGCAPQGAPYGGQNERLQSIYMETRGLPAREDCPE